MTPRRLIASLGASLGVLLLAAPLLAQAPAGGGATAAGGGTRIRDLTIGDEAQPVRLMGYGLVVGLDGSGDRGAGGRGSQQTVQSVANLLRRFDVDVPADLLRTQNVAAVLVTAEASPYLRSGGRFEVHVSSVGDARSLKGGVLWMTPLVADAGGAPVAAAQGPLLLSEGQARASRYSDAVETTARIPGGGVVEGDLPRPLAAGGGKLLLREPDLVTATRIAAAVEASLGAGTASVEDPGAVTITYKDGTPSGRATQMAKIRDLTVQRDRPSRVIIDSRDGTVVAGGDISVGEAVVSHGPITLSNSPGAPAAGAANAAAGLRGDVRLAAGTSVQAIAEALHAVRTSPTEVAAIFESLRDAGAISAEVVIR